MLTDWSFEEKQFGEIWSTAANKHGVMFLSMKGLLFWDGQNLIKVANAEGGMHRLFSIDDVFYFKANDSEYIYSIAFSPSLTINKTTMVLPEKALIRKIIKNNNNRLTIVTGSHGIYELIDKQLVQKLPAKQFPENSNIYNAIQASDGYYYLTSINKGVFIVDEYFKLLKNYTQDDGLGTQTILSVIEDFQGTIWFSGVPTIVKFIPPHLYSRYATDSQINNTEAITLLKNKVSVLGVSVHQLEINTTPLRPAYFKNIHTDNINTWGAIVFKNHLLYAGSGGIYVMEYSDNGQLNNHQNILKTAFAKDFALDVKSQTVFATTEEGLFRINFFDNSWQVDKIPNTEDELHYIVIQKGVIWTGTSTQELYRIENAQYDNIPTTVTKFSAKDGLGANNVLPFNTSLGMVFGTNDGLMDFKQDRQPQLQFLTDLPQIFQSKGMDVYRIYQDGQDNIWYRIGNRTGVLSQGENNQWQTNEDVFRYFPDSGYKGFVKSDDNILWFSLANGGIFRANTELIAKPPTMGKLNIRKIIDLDTDKEIYGGLGEVQLPTLSQDNNSIRIQFALADNSIANAKNANNVQYRHRLIGSNNEKFSKWSNESHKDFTLLRGNDYQFEVEAKDAWGRKITKKFDYVVLPPWYLSKTAWLVYALIVLSLIAVSSWLTQKWRTRKLNLRNLQLEKQVQERTADVQAKAHELKQQQELKDRFFTNVSHEFRTPLTLTIAPLEAYIDDNNNLDKKQLHPIHTALRNSKKMLSLVGQILDINRLESGRFPLHVAKYDLSDLINNVAKRFEVLAQQHQQTISVTHTNDPRFVYFDQDQLDKCVSNLVANAIKYSGDESHINIEIIVNENLTGIKVSDNGPGISRDFEDKIFQRFTQDEKSDHITEPGTGIGLALVKELMELHHGEAELQNEPGKGCDFILWLKNGSEHFDAKQLVEPTVKTVESSHMPVEISQVDHVSRIKNKHSDDVTTILVVDDNQELREFIASRLSSYFRILQANNGQEGLDMAIGQLPDLIVSDVMMPVMDGLQMTEQLKNHPLTQTLPIILLTAKSSKRETVMGLQSGADDYLTKPFDTSELIMRVNGLIKSRQLIRETIKAEFSLQLSHLDKTASFIDRLRYEILSQLSDPKLSVESLSSALAMNRHSLNKKCKSELNKTTGQIITETRMQQALSLLKLKKHSISEIAYGTGYDSLAYFSRIFKKHYGKTPSEVRNF
ncbi:MAG: ATP-binding protein [Proteobacteria bacterium]|nr:ATP-binding protein [Pseudomonadota bacterium]